MCSGTQFSLEYGGRVRRARSAIPATQPAHSVTPLREYEYNGHGWHIIVLSNLRPYVPAGQAVHAWIGAAQTRAGACKKLALAAAGSYQFQSHPNLDGRAPNL